jgi:hypothetical protein
MKNGKICNYMQNKIIDIILHYYIRMKAAIGQPQKNIQIINILTLLYYSI